MQEIYEKAWEKGGLQFRGSFSDLVTNVEANKTASDFIKNKINETVSNKKFAAILSDIDHPYAGKRPPIDTNYFETYNRDNVNLVDLRSNPITQIDEKGIFYLRARGIKRKQAQKMMMRAYIGEVLQGMKNEKANEILLEMTKGRARCFKVEARENDKNSAIFSSK